MAVSALPKNITSFTDNKIKRERKNPSDVLEESLNKLEEYVKENYR